MPRRSCAACTEAQKREYGCVTDSEHREHWIVLEGGEELRRCPYALVGARELRVVKFAGLIESGVLPDAGGWLDQSASYMDALPEALSARRQFERERLKHDRR